MKLLRSLTPSGLGSPLPQRERDRSEVRSRVCEAPIATRSGMLHPVSYLPSE